MTEGSPRISAQVDLLRDAQNKIRMNTVLGTRASFAAGYIDIAIESLTREEEGMAMVALSHAVHALAHALAREAKVEAAE